MSQFSYDAAFGLRFDCPQMNTMIRLNVALCTSVGWKSSHEIRYTNVSATEDVSTFSLLS